MNIQSLVESLSAWFPKRTDPGYAMAQVYPVFSMLYGAKFLYRPLETSPAGTILMRDILVGQQSTSAGDPALGYDKFLPYVNYDGVNDYFSRGVVGIAAFPADLSIITLVKFDAASMGATVGLVSAWATGFKAFHLGKTSGDVFTFKTADGVNSVSFNHSLTLQQDTWYFVAATKLSNTGKLYVSNPATKKLVVSSGALYPTPYAGGNGSLLFGATEVTGGGTIVDIFTGQMTFILQGSKEIPEAQVNHAYQVCRPLIGLA